MTFKVGDRVVTYFFKEEGEAGAVTTVYKDENAYAVLLDNDRGLFGDGDYFVPASSVEAEEVAK